MATEAAGLDVDTGEPAAANGSENRTSETGAQRQSTQSTTSEVQPKVTVRPSCRSGRVSKRTSLGFAMVVPNDESVFEALVSGTEEVDENDWAAAAQHKVFDGSDGLMIRLGPPVSEKLISKWFSIRFNPVVSCGSCSLLFGLVLLCVLSTPSEVCWSASASTAISEASEIPTGPNTACVAVIPGSTTATAAPPTPAPAPTPGPPGPTLLNMDGDVRLYMPDATYVATSCYVPSILFRQWELWVTACFTWLYIFTQDVWIIFLFVIFFSKYAKLKIGRDTDKPDFGNFSWFSMIFSAGVSTGLFFYGAAEPIYYYQHQQDGSNMGWGPQLRFTYLPTNKRAQYAILQTWYHWGLHGWVCYCLMGCLLGFLHFRKGLPMTVKTCFYPLIGADVYGFIGDIIDIISTVATTMGVCTSLGLGVMQLDAGIYMLNGGKTWAGSEEFYGSQNWDSWRDMAPDLKEYWKVWPAARKNDWWTCTNGTVHENYGVIADVATQVTANNQQMILVWVITFSATFSVMLGLRTGIQTLANVCMALGMFILTFIWVMDDSWFLLNLLCQSLGHYVQWLFEIGFHTSAFSGNEAGDQSTTDWANGNPGGEVRQFMAWWTIFYWGWWIAWAPFVGVFLARISRGRTIRAFIMGGIILPVLYSFVFTGILGGAGIRMQMLAEKYEIGCKTWGGGISTPTSETVDGQTVTGLMPYGRNICRTVNGENNIYTGEKELFCSTVFNMGCIMQNIGYPEALFYLMSQYSDMGTFLIGMTMLALFLYFIASSDSGSMVDDMVTANGIPEPPLLQRLFWSFTEGAAATALLHTGKYLGKADDSLKTLRSLSLTVGLPYTFLICFMCVALWRALQYEAGDLKWSDGWKSKIADIGITFYSAKPSLDTDKSSPTFRQASRVFNFQPGKVDIKRVGYMLAQVACPGIASWKLTHKLESRRKIGGSMRFAKGISLFITFLYYAFLLCCFCEYVPADTEPYVWGMVKSGYQNGVYQESDTRTYQSTRYGYFKEWTSDPRDDNGRVSHNKEYNIKAGETVAVGHTKPPGDQVQNPRRIEAVGWFAFFFMTTLITYLRGEVRTVCGISGNTFDDFLCSAFWAPVLIQMEEQILDGDFDMTDVVTDGGTTAQEGL